MVFETKYRSRQAAEKEYYQSNFTRKECIWPKITAICEAKNLQISESKLTHSKKKKLPYSSLLERHGTEHSSGEKINQTTANPSRSTGLNLMSDRCYCGRVSNHEVPSGTG